VQNVVKEPPGPCLLLIIVDTILRISCILPKETCVAEQVIEMTNEHSPLNLRVVSRIQEQNSLPLLSSDLSDTLQETESAGNYLLGSDLGRQRLE
jgi:hypothetical protein